MAHKGLKRVNVTTHQVRTYWYHLVWGPLSDSPELVHIHNPIAKLDHAKREIVAARFYEITTEAISLANGKRRSGDGGNFI